MKPTTQLFLIIVFIAAFASTSFAMDPEQTCSAANLCEAAKTCRAAKNREVARFVSCRYRSLSIPTKNKTKAKKLCQRSINRNWRKITKRTNSKEASCLEFPITLQDFKNELNTHILDTVTLLGKGTRANAAQKKCRSLKIRAAGKYTACRFRTETAFIRSSDSERRDVRLARCESNFKESWQRITARTEARGTSCLDDEQTADDFISAINSITQKISAVLAGQDEFSPLSLSITGSPLALIAGGAADSLTIMNLSNKGTALNIQAELSETALEDAVTISANTCETVAPLTSCSLTFSPGGAVVPITKLNIQGSNTEKLTASIEVIAPSTAILSVDNSPLSLTVNGADEELFITNTSSTTTALNVSSDITGTPLNGNIVESANTCSSIEPLATCTLTFTPGLAVIPETEFTVSGTNTNTLTPSISIESGSSVASINPTSGTASGGAGFTLTGTGFNGATSVTFNGIAATSVNVVNSTTITGVTPAGLTGVVDVVVDTPAGGATLTNGYTYQPTAVGQSSGGGTIACLNGGLNNLIATLSDNSTGIEWGGSGIAIGAGAQSTTDGASNTGATVGALGNNGGTPYAAQLCNDHEVDSQGNTPCQAGNSCYDDWFLPAGNNLTASGQLNCLYTNRIAIGGFAAGVYWGSTEFSASPAFAAWHQDFGIGLQAQSNKTVNYRVRCVRSFNP